MLVTPLQLSQATATLAKRGMRLKPHIVAATENPLTGQRDLVVPHLLNRVTIDNEFYWDSVLAAMHAVLQSEIGTARAVGLAAPYPMAGKSGTAQVFSVAQDEKYNKDEVAERLRDHALFIAFAPLDEPQIAVAVIVENGSSGSTVAAPIARAVMDEYLGFGNDDAV
jgi:penicillin-binding protein 2